MDMGIQNEITAMAIRPTIKQMLPGLVADMKKLECDFASIELEEGKCKYGQRSTGKFVHVIDTHEFRDIESRLPKSFKGLVTQNDIIETLSSIWIDVFDDFMYVRLMSSTLGIIEVKFKSQYIWKKVQQLPG